MTHQHHDPISRRKFLGISAAAAAGLSAAPFISCGRLGVEKPMLRSFGRIPFEVSTLGLGGQASLQWTPDGVDPVQIIHKAFDLGVNNFDTSNVYGPSQMNYGAAFRGLDLAPGLPGYNEKRRRSIFLTSKTMLRYAKGGEGRKDAGRTQGAEGSGAVEDLKRTLSQVFGDGHGAYPSGAYVDMVLIHNLRNRQDIDAVYEGIDNPDPEAERIGALAALRDYRDGTNLTGLNPRGEKLVRHLGFSGHFSAPAMMEMIQRDRHSVLDAMLVSINPNDRLNFNMQHNVIPVAAAKNMGIIAMKVFADGAMYTKEASWSRSPEHVVQTVGDPSLPSRPLVEYALTTPGIHTAIIGIGHIDAHSEQCQLQQNLSAAQVRPTDLSESDLRSIEDMTRTVKDGKTNYFQLAAEPLSPPRELAADQRLEGERRIVRLTWQTAYAGDEPLQHYEIWRGSEKIADLPHRPQTTLAPFAFEDQPSDQSAQTYRLVSVDAVGRTASSDPIVVPALG